MNPADAPFRPIADLVREHAAAQPRRPALRQEDDAALDYAALDALTDRVAAALQRDGARPGDVVAVCAATSPRYVALFLGALRAGVVVAPLAPSVTAPVFASMVADAGARALFVDALARPLLAGLGPAPARIALDDGADGTPFGRWLAPEGARPEPVAVEPEWPFNLIYSSGTTGTPKGIVQSHAMRWAHVRRAAPYDYGPQRVTLIATPLYSNTTLVVLFPSLAAGGCVVLTGRFDAARYVALAERQRATHTMLVPVQYQRIMALPDFDAHDLSAFRFKFCTSAPFPAALKAEVLRRWPGGLVEIYGMTEGGGTCILEAHAHPDKLHTVGRPAPGSELRLIDEAGREVAPGEAGEVVGRSAGMMTGYHRLPEQTRAAEWFDADGRRFIRTGDIGRFDADGFLILIDRRKDVIISGGFNVYPSDLEAVLRGHDAVADVAVVGVASAQWGETPVACVVRAPGREVDATALRDWANARLGRTQRLAALHFVDALPRSTIGKVLKRELRQRYGA